MAQVHGAVLKDGTEVIVKILRPDIQKFIKRDIEMLYFLANLANKYWLGSKNLKPLENKKCPEITWNHNFKFKKK